MTEERFQPKDEGLPEVAHSSLPEVAHSSLPESVTVFPELKAFDAPGTKPWIEIRPDAQPDLHLDTYHYHSKRRRIFLIFGAVLLASAIVAGVVAGILVKRLRGGTGLP
jgi:hypothetical protein